MKERRKKGRKKGGKEGGRGERRKGKKERKKILNYIFSLRYISIEYHWSRSGVFKHPYTQNCMGGLKVQIPTKCGGTYL
jgi:DNA invertase Pin-like site-specific DNA recombinase